MRASYPSHRGSQAESRGVSREPLRTARAVGGAGRPPRAREWWHDPCSFRPARVQLPLTTRPTEPSCSTGDPVVPYHTIAFSQQKLRAALRRAAGQDPAFTYGFVVHSRRYTRPPDPGPDHPARGEPGLERAAAARRWTAPPLWLFGHARITLGVGHARSRAPNDSRADPVDRPLSSLLMHIATFDTSAGVTQHLVQVEAQVKAETLVQPLLVLTHARPERLARSEPLAATRSDHLEGPRPLGPFRPVVGHRHLQHVVPRLEASRAAGRGEPIRPAPRPARRT